MAEDAATVDALSGARQLPGVARGGPLPFSHFGMSEQDSRDRMLEAMQLLERLLTEETVDFDGRRHHCRQISIYPRPVQRQIPIWLGSLSPESIEAAAMHAYGLMGGSAVLLEKLQVAVTTYRNQAEARAQPLVLSRYFCCHRDGRTAIARAVSFVRDFARNMGAVRRQAAEQGRTATPFGVDAAALAEERILANSIIGDVDTCCERIYTLREALGPHTLILSPAAYQSADNSTALSLFAKRIRDRF